jgi:hypothetical protein
MRLRETATIFTTGALLAGGLAACGEPRHIDPSCELKGADATTVQAETALLRGLANAIYTRRQQLSSENHLDKGMQPISAGFQFPLKAGGKLAITYSSSKRLKNGMADPNNVTDLTATEFAAQNGDYVDYRVRFSAIGCRKGWMLGWEAQNGNAQVASNSDYDTYWYPSPTSTPTVAKGVGPTHKIILVAEQEFQTLVDREPYHPGLILAPPMKTE